MFSKSEFREVVKSMGLVFGDIGTSPIYTLTVIFLLTRPTHTHIIGVLSLIIWTLIVLVTMEYAWLAMSLGKKRGRRYNSLKRNTRSSAQVK
ncbi:KUP/HAK/KT family potassium transporter [Methanosarcina barkeri]|uniref:KUP/HAK/KT family potassium transporter n=1 Tax=Methanosarcina barkeri TaxID=2208 RepID=UPI000AAF3EB5|nr:KUP/HAK/KT family potassium transporter [Methanosarcina barkeri]